MCLEVYVAIIHSFFMCNKVYYANSGETIHETVSASNNA